MLVLRTGNQVPFSVLMRRQKLVNKERNLSSEANTAERADPESVTFYVLDRC